MNIASSKNMNIASSINNSNTNFQGRIITRGKWPETLKKEFLNNPEIVKLASGKHNIIGNLSSKTARKAGQIHIKGQTIYKLKISAEREAAALKDRILNFLGINKSYKVTQKYHSSETIIDAMSKKIQAQKLKNKLGI